jgi:NADH-quinone oxidoreductase subunit H
MDFLTDPLGVIRAWLASWLAGFLPADAVNLILVVLGAFVVGTVGLVLPLFLIWYERRVIARMQDRVGPNRVGPEGLFQTIADALKLLIKEDITPIGADKVVYNLAPIMAVVSVLTMWAVIPLAVNIVGTDLNIGVLYIVSVGSLGTLAIMLGGWASNNKYALLGAFRTVAQLVCYEVPMILALIVPVLLASSVGPDQGITDPMSMQQVVRAQSGAWYDWFLFKAPIAFLIFFITSVAETGRAPFDLLEAESEIVSGFNIEYSGMKFGMFFVAEFLHAFTVGALVATLFLGGWSGPGVAQFPLLGVVYFVAKAFAAYFIVILLRAALPRIRIDHMLDLNWKFLVPITLGAIVATAVADKVFPRATVGPFWNALALFAGNLVVAWIAFAWVATVARRLRSAEASRQPPGAPAPAGHDDHGHPAPQVAH